MRFPSTWIRARIDRTTVLMGGRRRGIGEKSSGQLTYESERNAMPQRYVIVGANLAGGTAAITLREEGFDGEIVLIGAEPHPPYERPPLSKEYLQGVKPFEDALLKPSSFYEDQNIQMHLGRRVVRVDPSERTVEREDGGRVPYDRLLVATGVRNRKLRIPGAD